jgi:hypothetical protein
MNSPISNQESQFMRKKRKTLWRLWAKALGEKATKNDREADHIAGIRTFLFLSYLITNCFIVAGIVRHWNDGQNEIPGCLLQIEEGPQKSQTNGNFL